MRVEVQKWLIVASHEQKEDFFKKAQEIGILEFISSKTTSKQPAWDQENLVLQAIHLLQPVKPLEDPNSKKLHASCDTIAAQCVQTHQKIESASSKLIHLEQEYERIRILGEFSLEQLNTFEKQTSLKPQFIFAKSSKSQPLEDGMFKIGSSEGVDYYIWFNQGQELAAPFTLMHLSHDPKLLRQLIQQEKHSLEKLQHQMQSFKEYEEDLKHYLINSINLHTREQAQSLACDQNNGFVFYALGWVASHRIEELQQLAEEFKAVAVQVPVEPNEIIPTYLENSPVAKIGEDLINIYDAPAYDDKDPSMWVLVFFAIFFAIIIGDGGYGLMFLVASLYAYKKINAPQALVLRMKKLALILSCSCVIWGLFSNSFFGIQFEPSHPIRQVSLLHHLCKAKARYHWLKQDQTYHNMINIMPQLNNMPSEPAQKILEQGYIEKEGVRDYYLVNNFSDLILREFALLIGVVHLSISLLRYIKRNWAAIGWVVFLVGSWLYFPKLVQATTFVNYLFYVTPDAGQSLGLDLIYLGIAWSLVIAVVQNGWIGLLEFMNLIQVFSDGLSYLRLYALGLAGGIMSAVFNQLAISSGVFCGFFIIILGHLVNITLAIMGGVIHGLRLNFLEWYHYSFSGGGRWHTPLKKIEDNESAF